MNFKKTLFAAALVSLPVAGFSLEAMDDETLSGVTGQDGISINIATPAAGIGGDIYVHDTTGFTGATNDGAIVIDGFKMVSGAGGIGVSIDAGSTAADNSGSDVLQIAISIPNNTVIETGAIGVANSARDTPAWGLDSSVIGVMNNMTITLGATTVNIQLGDELQNVVNTPGQATDMIAISTTMTGGLVLSSVGITDANNSGTMGEDTVTIVDTGGTDLAVAIAGNVTAAGLILEVGTLGTGGADIRVEGAYLGTNDAAHTIGDIEIVGLQTAGTVITITGKL